MNDFNLINKFNAGKLLNNDYKPILYPFGTYGLIIHHKNAL